MGKKKSVNKFDQVHTSLPPSMIDDLDSLADGLNMSRSELIKLFIECCLDHDDLRNAAIESVLAKHSRELRVRIREMLRSRRLKRTRSHLHPG